MPPRSRKPAASPAAAAAAPAARARPPSSASAGARPASPPSPTTTTSPAVRGLFLVLVNVIAAAALYNRVSSGAIPFPEPVARLVGDVTVGLGLAEALPGLAAASSSASAAPSCGLLGETSFILASSRVVFPDGAVRPGALLVRNGKIAAMGASAEALQPAVARAAAPLLAALGAKAASNVPLLLPLLQRALPSPLPVHDFGYSAISPGVIDVHAHLNEPGREEWEGVATGTAAAAAGGVTAVVDMPLNSAPAAVTADLLVDKARAVRQAGPRVDVALWGGLVPQNAADEAELRRMLDEAGALGFKSFMCPSGIRDFDHVAVSDVRAALPILMRLGAPYLVHAELVDPPEGSPAREGADAPVEPPAALASPARRKYATYLATRPASFERDAIGALIAELADATHQHRQDQRPGFRLHVVHLGDASSLAALAAAKRRLPALSVETCPHYLLFDETSVRDGDTRFKCAPPLRSAENRAALLEALVGSPSSSFSSSASSSSPSPSPSPSPPVIDLVSSDHSPAPASLKAHDTGDFISAWGGINGLQYLLPATWTALRSSSAAAAGSGDSAAAGLAAAARLLSSAPAALAGLAGRKGALRPGLDADVVVWDPEAQADTTAAANRHKHGADTSPYVGGAPLRGRVLATFVRGSLVFDARRPAAEGQVAEAPSCGQLITRAKRIAGGGGGGAGAARSS